MSKISVEDVLDCMSLSEWQTVEEIWETYAPRKRCPYSRMHRLVNTLEDEGLVSARHRDISDEQFEARGKRNKWEYKLTDGGHKRRVRREKPNFYAYDIGRSVA